MDGDPYRPPAHLEYTHPRASEDVVRAPRVMGVFSMVLAIIAIAIAGIFLYLYSAIDGDDDDEPAEATTAGDEDPINEEIRLLSEAFTLEISLLRASALALLLMSIALMVIGFGQRRYRRWARRASVGWGVLGLLLLATAIGYSYAVVQPAWEAVLDGALTGGAEGSSPGWSGVLKYVLFVPYPIAMILVFAGSRVGRAMSR